MSSPSFPLALDEFWRNLRFADRPEFVLQSYKQQSMDGSGNIMGAKFGQQKWRVDVMTAAGRHDADMDMQALVKALIGRDGAFLAYDTRRPFPKADPLGTVIAGATPTVRTVGDDNRSLSMQALPNGYDLTLGDYLLLKDGTGLRSLHQIMESIGANGSGDTQAFEVQPFLPTWIAVDQAVDLARPAPKFKILAGSYKPQSGSGNQSTGFGFSIISYAK
jgi:hypothetical protein